MSEADDRKHALAQAEAHIMSVREDPKASIMVLVVRSDKSASQVFLGHDSAALLLEVGKAQRFLERAIDEDFGMRNQAGEFTWAPN